MTLKEQKEIVEILLVKAWNMQRAAAQELCAAIGAVNLSRNKMDKIRSQIDAYLKAYDVKVLQYTEELEFLERKMCRETINAYI